MSVLGNFLIRMLELHGYEVLFFALLLEMLALPLPGELLLTYGGILMYEGRLELLPGLFAAGAGAAVGMTIAYIAGYRLGKPFFARYGARLHFGPERLDGLSGWFGRYGDKLLLFAYFIPGIRHMTGYFSGTTRLSYRRFAAFAYSGAFFWAFVFLTLGRLLGSRWETYHHEINLGLMFSGAAAAAILLLARFVRRHRGQLVRVAGALGGAGRFLPRSLRGGAALVALDALGAALLSRLSVLLQAGVQQLAGVLAYGGLMAFAAVCAAEILRRRVWERIKLRFCAC